METSTHIDRNIIPILKPFGRDIWIVDGPNVVAGGGFHYPTRSAVIRLFDGTLFVWSPVALTHELGAAIDALGEVRYLIAPNSLHHVFIPEWKEAYPAARIYAAPGLREKRKDIDFDDDLGESPAVGWSSDIDQVVVRGNAITTEVVFFHRASRTVLFTDLLQQLPRNWFKGWRAIVAGLDLMLGQEPSVPRKFRVAFTNRRDARAAVERILAWPVDMVLMAHGTPVAQNGLTYLQRAFRWLLK